MTKSKKLLLGTCIALSMASTPLWAADSIGTTVDDTMVTAKVKAALIDNPATKARQINVDTQAGTVQLNGFVDSASEKQAAETEAKGVVGVKKVVNNLQVRSGERTAGVVIDDSAITAKVKTALLSDSRTKGYEVNVKTNNGIVSLGGFVASAQEKQAAESVAGGVAGVVKVENGITVGKK
ncbi:MAG: BON domain-containing protein [Steroidobacteraceae bacterium]